MAISVPFVTACLGCHPPRSGVFLSEQREQEAERLKKEAAGLRREASLPKAELEARGEALRQVSTAFTPQGLALYVSCDFCVKKNGECPHD